MLGGFRKFSKITIICIVLFIHIESINGHGMMLEPIGRASRWRIDKTANRNYDDMGLFCGGMWVQWEMNKGKCGLCGDNYRDPTPRAHELGGKYGQGIIVETYDSSTGIIPVGIRITANHRGSFTWDICNLDTDKKESDECFAKHKVSLEDGSDKYEVTRFEPGWFNTTLKIPKDLQCKHCVLRWTYRTGNSWGICEDGKGALGCGKQEHFRSCADITIKA